MISDPFRSVFGDPAGNDDDRRQASKVALEIYLADAREIVDTHIRGFENLGMSREEALCFAGQLHHHLIAAVTTGRN